MPNAANIKVGDQLDGVGHKLALVERLHALSDHYLARASVVSGTLRFAHTMRALELELRAAEVAFEAAQEAGV
jgi:hypothetical protein